MFLLLLLLFIWLYIEVILIFYETNSFALEPMTLERKMPSIHGACRALLDLISFANEIIF